MGEAATHECIREEDFTENTRKIEAINEELEEEKSFRQYAKEEFIIIKDALGVKDRKNGDRDKQLKEIFKRATEIGAKAEEEDRSIREDVKELNSNLSQINYNLGVVMGALGLTKIEKQNKRSRSDIILGAAIGGIITLIVGIVLIFLEVAI